MIIRGRIFLRGEECKDPHERIGFWSRKIPFDQFGVNSTRIKNKNRPGELMSRRDNLVAEIPTLDSSGRVLIIMVEFYSSWKHLYKSETRFDGQENVCSRTGSE